MLHLPTPVYFIAFAQALGGITAPMIIFVGGFLGVILAPTNTMATLPIACMVVGMALASMPGALIMRRIGRSKGFTYATLIAILGSILAFFSVRNGHFFGLCFSTFLLGMHLAFVQQFRFAALEWVSPEQAPSTASLVMIGGLLAAWFGPELAMWGKDLLAAQFSGAFVLLAMCQGLLLVLINSIEFAEVNEEEEVHSSRGVLSLLKDPAIGMAITAAAVGFGVMSLIMTGTPVSMSEIQTFPLEDTKTVIQSHIIAMFLPSLFAAFLFKILPLMYMMLAGVFAMVLAITVAISDQSYWGYWFALVLLGVGWNFLFASGTGLLAQSYESHERFQAQAVNELCVFGTQATVSLMAGWIVFTYGWFALNLLAIPLLMFALVIMARWMYAKKSE